MNKCYDRRYESLNISLHDVSEFIEETEKMILDCKPKIESLRKQCLQRESVYESLKLFDKLYDKMFDYEMKSFARLFVDN